LAVAFGYWAVLLLLIALLGVAAAVLLPSFLRCLQLRRAGV
jgi:type II secretory pathway pseudopilin PulG